MTQFKYMENVTDQSNHGELLAPNGKPSNLSPELYAYVRTPEFKEFFGDWEKGKGIGHSCVLDGNGEPLVLYRGQWSHEDKPFVNYGDGIYFTPQREAAIGYGLDNDPIPAFVNARKPCKVDFDGDADTEDNDLHADVKSEYRYAAKEGYDILIATNTHDGENYLDQYVVVDNSQIRRIDTLDLEAILSRNVSFYNQSIHMNDSNSNDLGSDGKEFYLKAERELKKFIGEEGIDFKQRLGMPLCIVNDSFGSDSKYVKPQDAYINEIGFRDGKLSVKGNIDDDGVPVKVNGLQDLGRQGIKNLIDEVREMHEAQRLSDSLKDVVSELKDTNLLNEPIELKHPVQIAYMNASHVKVVENLSVASVESAESIMLYTNSRDAMGGFNPYFLSDLDRGKIYQVIDDLKDVAASRKNALSDIKSLSEEERAGLIDFYLSGDMPKKDSLAFEKAMENDPALKEDVRMYALIIHGIKEEGLKEENNRLQRVKDEAKENEKSNKPEITPSLNKEDKTMSNEKDQKSVGEVVNAVQEEKKAQPEKKATNNEIGKEAKSIIHLDTIAEKVRGKNENPDQSVVIVRSRDVASKANVYQAFGEDAVKLSAQSKNVELSNPAINGKQYSVAKFPEESAKSVAKDLAAANVSVNLVNGRGESIANDKNFSQAANVKEAAKEVAKDASKEAVKDPAREAQKENATPKQAASNANSERINDAVSKAYEGRIEAFNQAKQSAKENSVVIVEIKQPKEDKSYFQSFGKDAQTIAALLNKEVKNTPQNVNYVSLNKNDLDKLTPLLEKDGMKAVKVAVNDNLKETVKEIANPSKSVAIAENSKVQYEIGKNMHAQGIYDIKLYVDEKKVAAHHITKEDRNAFFNKEVTAKDLVAKYFSKELNGATPEVSRFQKADLTTVNNQSVTNAHVFKSEKGNLFFSANLDGKPLSPQFITEEKAKGFKEGKISLEDMMKAAYPTKMAPKLSDEQFNSPAISDGRKIDYFRIAKEQDQSKADYGKYKLSAGVDGQHFKSGALPLKDLNEYFDKVASKATLVERRFGEALQLKSAFEKYRLPDGLKMGENASFNIEKDNAQRRYFISGELKGSSLERKELSFNDAKAYWKHSATEEQLGAKYYPKEIKAAVKVKDVELSKEREYSLKR